MSRRRSSHCAAQSQWEASTVSIAGTERSSTQFARRGSSRPSSRRPAPADRARQQGGSPDDARAAARAPRGRRRCDRRRRVLHPGASAAHAAGVRGSVPACDRRRGRRRRGGLPLRRAPFRDLTLLERLGFEVVVAPELQGISSTAVRAAVAGGDVRAGAALLGRPFELDGIVVAGDQRGGTLGYPTANLRLEPGQLARSPPIHAGIGPVTRPRSQCRDRTRLRRPRAPNRAPSPRLRGRSLRKAARDRALGATPRRGRVRDGGRAGGADRARRRGDAARSQAVTR